MSAGVVEVAEENYSVAAGCAAGAVFVAIILCFACQRKMKRRVREDQIDDMQQQVDDRRHCYHHNHSLLDHQQHHHYQYPQQNHAHSHRNSFSQMDEPALPLSDESEADQASSPDSVWPRMFSAWMPSPRRLLASKLYLFRDVEPFYKTERVVWIFERSKRPTTVKIDTSHLIIIFETDTKSKKWSWRWELNDQGALTLLNPGRLLDCILMRICEEWVLVLLLQRRFRLVVVIVSDLLTDLLEIVLRFKLNLNIRLEFVRARSWKMETTWTNLLLREALKNCLYVIFDIFI